MVQWFIGVFIYIVIMEWLNTFWVGGEAGSCFGLGVCLVRDKALDLAVVEPPYLSIHAHPVDELASIVRWPIAAVPRNGARKRSQSASTREVPNTPLQVNLF